MKIKSLLVIAIAILASTLTQAKNVDIITAEKVARNYYYQEQNFYATPIDFSEIKIINRFVESRNGANLLYIFEIQGDGFIVVSAEDVMTPVIAHITKNEPWNLENANPEFKYVMDEYLDMVEYTRENSLPQEAEVAAAWALYTTDDAATLISSKEDRDEIGPLLRTVWNQDYPYNYYCPPAPGGPGGRCYAGCVATAMSVLMEYWRWPEHGRGSTTFYSTIGGFLIADYEDTYYDWDAMLTSINQNSEDCAIFANALLQYHCGIGVQMNYGPDGSGAYSFTVPYVMKTFFRYSEDIDVISKSDGYTQEQWNEIIYDELSQQHVLYYSGCSESGCHAFNCDGWRNTSGTDYHHFNFNWSGSGNGWYVSTNPGGFNTSNNLVINAVPDTVNETYPMYASGQKVLTDRVGRVMDGSGPVNNYIPTEASWLIDPANDPADSVVNITVSWEFFKLAAGDYVRIYDGATTDDQLLGEYTGTSLPSSVTSTGKQLLITFSAVGSGEGFTFIYTSTRPTYCSGLTQINDDPCTIEVAPEGMYYQPLSLCRYKVDYGKLGIKISFDYLDTYDQNDFLQIYDSKTDELYTFYGSETPEDLYIEGFALLTFKSDNFNSSNYGFRLTCTSWDGIEDCEEQSSDIVLYPNPASETVRIELTADNDFECKLISPQGAVVYSEMFDASTSNINLNVSNLPKGVYVLQLINNEGILTKKLIIE